MSAIVSMKDFLLNELCGDSESFLSVRTMALGITGFNFVPCGQKNEPDISIEKMR